MVRRGAVGVAAAVALLVLAAHGAAAGGGAERYARSHSPYWQVGRLDARLSEACRRGTFNQRSTETLYIGYGGESGPGMTGIGDRTWNLRDPTGLARRGVTYHFRYDGFATCRVYVASHPPGARTGGRAPGRR
jgi:hypothetical protein